MLRIVYESVFQALQELNGNKLRSFLSCLGITIGIFCIISVLSAVDSLESNISESFEELGADVLYVSQMPWNEDPGANWWKYSRRPTPDYADYQAIRRYVQNAAYASLSIFVPGRTIEYRASNVRGGYMAGITYDYTEVTPLSFEQGRYFTPLEYETAANRVIIGHRLAAELFPREDPIGKTVKIYGQRFQVIGVLKKEGSSMVRIFDYDEAILVGFPTVKKLVNVRTGTNWGTMLNVKAKPGVELVDLRDEVTGVLRAHRKLKPRAESNFAVNELSMITDVLRNVFQVMNYVGLIIGAFAIIVGIFSVANIMFVSVKERTSLIGIKKALGARRGVILLEFLIESVILCLIGGVVGLLISMGILKLISGVFNYPMFVSATNVLVALVGAIVIGIISGIIPALQASNLDPVEAIRQ